MAPVMAVFGEPVLYQPSGGEPFTITGVFNEAYRELAAVGEAIPISGERPVLGVRLAEFVTGEPRQGDALTLTRTGEAYWVREVRKDGHGGARFILNAVNGC